MILGNHTTFMVAAPPGVGRMIRNIRGCLIPMGPLVEESYRRGGRSGGRNFSRVFGWLFTKEIAEESAVNIGGVTAKQAGTLRGLLLKIPGAKQLVRSDLERSGHLPRISDLDIAIIGQINKNDPATVGPSEKLSSTQRTSELVLEKEGRTPLDIHNFPIG